MELHKPAPIRRLPLIIDFADAEALATERNDPFYLVAFQIQYWLGQLLASATAQYAEHKDPRDRSLQSGEAFRTLTEIFNLKSETPAPNLRPPSPQQSPLSRRFPLPGEMARVRASLPPKVQPSAANSQLSNHSFLLGCLYRFSVEDNSPRNTLRHALARLSIEHHCTGDYFGIKTLQQFSQNSTPLNYDLSTINQRTLKRLCQWLDSEIHLRTHRHWHESPAAFDPDPETRYLAALGNTQRHLANLDLHAQTCWVHHMAHAAQQFKNSPKWAALGKAMSDNSDRSWLYPEVDTLVIGLWPVVTAFNWTYRDLLNVIRALLKRPETYPCTPEHEFPPYCRNVLGLKKARRGRSAKNGHPLGFDIAQHLCHPNPRQSLNT
jgi:hypothetical protein